MRTDALFALQCGPALYLSQDTPVNYLELEWPLIWRVDRAGKVDRLTNLYNLSNELEEVFFPTLDGAQELCHTDEGQLQWNRVPERPSPPLLKSLPSPTP